jgi:hypothetical protein
MSVAADAVVLTVAAFFLAMGVYALAAPTRLIAPFRITADSPEARTEIRAVYGGFGVAVAVLLILAVIDAAGVQEGAVVAVAAALLGMASGRLIGRLFDKPSGFYPIWLYFWVELLGGGLLLATLRW